MKKPYKIKFLELTEAQEEMLCDILEENCIDIIRLTGTIDGTAKIKLSEEEYRDIKKYIKKFHYGIYQKMQTTIKV